MVKERMDLLELLRKGGMDGDVDFLREALRVVVEGIMDAEVSSRIGAEYGERSPERVTQRNGYRSRAWDTRVGTMDLHIPKLREGSYFPSLLEPRRRSERVLLAVIQQAYVGGVSTRRVDDLVKALGCEGISKSQVSRICQELDASWAVRWALDPTPICGWTHCGEPLDFAEQRLRAKVRDGMKCQKCGSRADLHVHHTEGMKSHTLSNLTTLCRTCHKAVHRSSQLQTV